MKNNLAALLAALIITCCAALSARGQAVSITPTYSSTPCTHLPTLTALPGGSACYTYTWSGPGAPATTQTIDPNALGGAGTYTVIVKDNCAGTTLGTASFTVYFPAACCAEALWTSSAIDRLVSDDPALSGVPGVIPANAGALITSFASSSITTTGNIVFDGNFNVNQNLQFAGCPNIYLTGGTEMTVADGIILNTNTSTFRPACNEMWTGIKGTSASATAPNVIDISQSTTFIGMDLGIRGTNQTVVRVSGAHFIDCWHGVVLTNSPSSYLGYVNSSSFVTAGTLLPPHAADPTGDRGVIGSNIHNLDVTGCRFDRLQCGVWFRTTASSTNTILNLQSNSYTEMRGMANYTVATSGYEGTGVFADLAAGTTGSLMSVDVNGTVPA